VGSQDYPLTFTSQLINNKMKKIKEMVESAPTKKDAIDILNIWHVFKGLSDSLYNKGRELITKEFKNR
jgi:hypothetical protein